MSPPGGIRLKLFLASLGLLAVSVVATDRLVSPRVEVELTRQIVAELEVRLDLVQREALHAATSAAAAAAGGQPAARSWDALADDLGPAAHARVTFIAPDGKVLGDSELSGPALAAAENHADRPEVVAALASGRGSSQRMSATVKQPMLYVAGALREGGRREGRLLGLVRVAMPLTEVQASIARVRRAVLLASVAALAVGALLAMLAAHAMSGRVRRLTEAARRMAAGDLDVRTGVTGRDELGTLGRALERLVENLAGTMAQLRNERDVSGRVLEAMREGVMVLDESGRVALVNPALREMLLLGSDVLGKLPGEATRNPEIVRILDEASAGESVASEIDVGGLKPRRLLVKATPLPGRGGGMLAVVVDVTEMRRLETVRRDFVANVSHELRTPLAAVAAATETLEGGAINDPGSARQFLGMIERNVQRLQRLLDDVLDLSRLEAREFRLDLVPLDLGPLAEQQVALFEHRAAQKRIRLTVEVPPDVGRVMCDREAVEHVLSNLIDNAVKYCPAGASVTVQAAADGPRARIAVADTGAGIDRRHLPRLFERFYRVDAGRSRDVGGTGLGLSIVKHLVEAMGGAVSVESHLGRGTVFTFTLPRA